MNKAIAFFLLLSATGIFYAQEDVLASSIEKGEHLYRKNCAVCHSKKGSGKGKRIPPLAGSDYLMSNRAESIKAIKYGLEGEITVNGVVYDKVMKAVELNDQEVADVMNYVLNTWGNRSDKIITAAEVTAVQKD